MTQSYRCAGLGESPQISHSTHRLSASIAVNSGTTWELYFPDVAWAKSRTDAHKTMLLGSLQAIHWEKLTGNIAPPIFDDAAGGTPGKRP